MNNKENFNVRKCSMEIVSLVHTCQKILNDELPFGDNDKANMFSALKKLCSAISSWADDMITPHCD